MLPNLDALSPEEREILATRAQATLDTWVAEMDEGLLGLIEALAEMEREGAFAASNETCSPESDGLE